MIDRPLTPKQKRFCAEYVVDLNGTAAYKRAGYSCNDNVARTNSHRMLANDNIRAEIEKLQAERSKATAVTSTWVMAELAKIAGFDPRRLFNGDGSVKLVNEWDDGTAASIASIDTAEIFTGQGEDRHCIGLSKKVVTRDKVRALELLGKHLGMFPTKSVVEVGETLESLIVQGMQQGGRQ